jgi:hypothetical protein
MPSRCVQQICPQYCNAETPGKGEGHGWVIEDTAVFTSDECTNVISHMDGKIRFTPLKNPVTSSIFLMTFVP